VKSVTAIALEAMLHWMSVVSVGRRFGNERRAQHAGDAQSDSDDHLLAPEPRQAIGNRERPTMSGDVPGPNGNDITDGLAWNDGAVPEVACEEHTAGHRHAAA
jgi:hypothetical protein